ncbi:O-antigen ligase family protein [Phocaeicola sp.]
MTLILLLIIAIQFFLLWKGILKSIVFYLCIVLLIPYVVKFSILGLGVLYSQILQLILLGGLLVCWNTTKNQNRGFYLPFLFLLSYSVFIIPFTSVPWLLQFQTIIKILLSYIPIFIAIQAFRNSKDIRLLNKWLFYICWIMVVYGFIVYIAGRNFYMEYLIGIYGDISNTSDYMSFMESERAGLSHRISSTMAHPLSYGQTLLLFFIYFMFMDVPWKKRIWHYFLILLIIANVFMSGSRSCILPMCVAICIRLFFMKKRYLIVLLIIFCVSLLAFPVFLSVLSEYYSLLITTVNGTSDVGGSNMLMRFNQLDTFFTILSSNILLGRGNGFVAYQGDSYPEMLGYESVIFTQGADYGLIGLLLYFGTFFSVVKLANKYNVSYQGNVYVITIVLCYLLSIIMTGMQGLSFLFFWILSLAYLNIYSCKK